MKQSEIRRKGYKACLDALGVVKMLRFLPQLEISLGNYTIERHQPSKPALEEFQQFTSSKWSAD